MAAVAVTPREARWSPEALPSEARGAVAVAVAVKTKRLKPLLQ